MADKSQQTEKPTPKRLKKAREDGNFPSAREFVSSMHLLTFVVLAAAFLPEWLGTLERAMSFTIRQAFVSDLDARGLLALFTHLSVSVLKPLAILGGMLMGTTLLINVLLTNFGISFAKLAPSFNKINPAAKLRQLPGQNMTALIQGVVLLPIMFAVSYYVLRDQMPAILSLPMEPLTAIAAFSGTLLATVLRKAAMVLLAIGAILLAKERNRYNQSLKMSKQEVRDEGKENDGNPHVKAKIRRLQRDMRRRNMMKDVATATAVVVNPTHYAVAIRWEAGMGAPMVVAKGKNYLAARIRKRAIENQVPIIENPPLAQALYKSVEVGQEIPANLYRAVAEILAYIFRMMRENGTRQTGNRR